METLSDDKISVDFVIRHLLDEEAKRESCEVESIMSKNNRVTVHLSPITTRNLDIRNSNGENTRRTRIVVIKKLNIINSRQIGMTTMDKQRRW